MRVTNNASFSPYLRQLNLTQESKYKNELRVSTGDQNLSLSDGPTAIVNTKQVAEKMERNVKYLNNINEAYNEMMAVNDSLASLQDQLATIRQLSIDATQTGNMGNLDALAIDIKGYLEDFISEANSDYKGKYLFSGTLTDEESISKTELGTNLLPYELVEGEATAENPSGLQVIFKGNYESRAINKDSTTNEVINTDADKVFGNGATEAFEAIIGLYNTLAFTETGEKRTKDNVVSKTDTGNINKYQKILGDFSDFIAKANSINGAKMNRLDSIRSQMQEENIRLKSLKSEYSDTDYAAVALQLKKDDAALTYTLQIGSSLMNNSLFDFLSL